MYMEHVLTHANFGQAALTGFSNLSPPSSILTRVTGFTPGYGVLPALNTSQQVIPNDHCIGEWNEMCHLSRKEHNVS